MKSRKEIVYNSIMEKVGQVVRNSLLELENQITNPQTVLPSFVAQDSELTKDFPEQVDYYKKCADKIAKANKLEKWGDSCATTKTNNSAAALMEMAFLYRTFVIYCKKNKGQLTADGSVLADEGKGKDGSVMVNQVNCKLFYEFIHKYIYPIQFYNKFFGFSENTFTRVNSKDFDPGKDTNFHRCIDNLKTNFRKFQSVMKQLV